MVSDSHLPDVDAADAEHDDPADGSEITGVTRTYVARVETYEDSPDQCTIFPRDAGADELPTTWLSAEAGSFVALDEMR
ncbi:hypothetical protein DVK02_08325 [Halobellus sp. Atlit-31R]|nr:hypothetical protein DVK02_08325 [Halobellus sp. Atlit-31R]